MRNLEKYEGVIPAFYACFDENGEISPKAVQDLTRYFIDKGVKGVYVNGSSGECIYLTPEQRKTVLENVMEANDGSLTVIAHVACNSTKKARNWQNMLNLLVLMPSHPFRQFISSFQNTQSLNTGTTFLQQLQTLTLSSTTFHS